jgi:hypothetical protein
MLSGEFITIVLYPNELVVSWFQQSKNSLKIIPKAWEVSNLDSLQIERGIIFNPTVVAEFITQFFKKNNLKKCFVSVGLADTLLWEHCCWIIQERPTIDHLPYEARTLVWNYAQLWSDENSYKKLFYLFGLPREILFQYQLLSLRVPFHCCTITAKNRALLYAISAIYRVNIAPDFFSGNLEHLSNYCLELFDRLGYEKIFEKSDIFYQFLQEHKESMIASLGLFLLGKNYELQ